MVLLQTEKMYAGYKYAQDIVKDISISVNRNEIVGLFGTNGAGKSTILKALSGMLYQQTGRILFCSNGDGECRDISKLALNERSRLGIKYLTQDSAIFSAHTVKENILFACGYDKSVYQARSGDIFELFPDLKDACDMPGALLSGGQREKTAIAMVLITRPELLLLDEPSAGLAPGLVGGLLTGIKDYVKNGDSDMSVLLIEQQKLYDAKNICDSLYLLKDGELTGINDTHGTKMAACDITDKALEQFMLATD